MKQMLLQLTFTGWQLRAASRREAVATEGGANKAGKTQMGKTQGGALGNTGLGVAVGYCLGRGVMRSRRVACAATASSHANLPGGGVRGREGQRAGVKRV
jgi:hypothetical protein